MTHEQYSGAPSGANQNGQQRTKESFFKRKWFIGTAAFLVGLLFGAVLVSPTEDSPRASGEAGNSASKQSASDKYSGAPSLGKRALKIGETRKNKKFTMTVEKVKDNYSKNLPPGNADLLKDSGGGDRWFAVLVKTCVVGTLAKPLELFPGDFNVGTSVDDTYETPGSYDSAFPSPRYPMESITTGCRRGWINYGLKDDVHPDRVYGIDSSTSETIAEWRF